MTVPRDQTITHGDWKLTLLLNIDGELTIVAAHANGMTPEIEEDVDVGGPGENSIRLVPTEPD